MQPTASANRATRRRAQNAAAQRTYRAKQKQKMQRLEALTIAALASSSSSTSFTGISQEQPPPPAANHATNNAAPTVTPPRGPAADFSGAAGAGDVTFARVHAALGVCTTPRERRTFDAIVARERFGLRDVVRYGLIGLGRAMRGPLFEEGARLPARAWLARVRAAAGDGDGDGDEGLDVVAVLAAGVKLLAGLPMPTTTRTTTTSLLSNGEEEGEEEERGEEWIRAAVAAPLQSRALGGRITLAAVALGSALAANAALLGIPARAMREDEDLPALPALALRCGPPDLRPTAAQLAVAHHPVFDVIPWPAFRSSLCLALAAGRDPLLADDGGGELCLDLMNDGIRCWGSTTTTTGGGGRGGGAPWESRSWEAAPWFLEKWEGLTGGRDGDMWRNSEWWRDMRG